MLDYRVFVQARMSSSRFPGKMLAPLCGRPLIATMLDRLSEAVESERIVVLTSEHQTDDPLALYVKNALGVAVFRGPLNDVFDRVQSCLKIFPCEWFVRISGDSPAIDPGLLTWMLDRLGASMDILTNVAERTFPSGQSLEILRSSMFSAIDRASLSEYDREHVTTWFYRNPDSVRMVNVRAVPSKGDLRCVVDTLQDLESVERMLGNDVPQTRNFSSNAVLVPQ